MGPTKEDNKEVFQFLESLSPQELEQLSNELEELQAKPEIKKRVKKLDYRVCVCHTRKCTLCGNVATRYYKATIISTQPISTDFPYEIFEETPFCEDCDIVLMGMPKREVIRRAIESVIKYYHRTSNKCPIKNGG